jgi:hypothetical protein
MMTVNDFKTNTTIPRRGRGGELKAIDVALEKYLAQSTLIHLNVLMLAINHWVGVKALKHKDGASENYNTRQGVVLALRAEAEQELANRFAGGNASLSTKVASYERHKAEAKDASKPKVKGLEPGYDFERLEFQAWKGQAGSATPKADVYNPGSAGVVGEALKNIRTNPAAFAGKVAPQLIAVARDYDLATISPGQWDELHGLIRAATEPPAQANQLKVHFARKEERIDKFLTFAMGGQFFKQLDVPYVSNNDMYAIDEYGNLLTVNANKAHIPAGGQAWHMNIMAQHNHSTLNAGANVICAGMMAFANGYITLIDNRSGHYKPTRKNLHDAVASLVEADNANLSSAVIKVYEMKNDKLHIESYHHWKTFYDNPKAAPNSKEIL